VIKKRLEIKENHDSGVQVQDCQIKVCNSVAELQACLAQGNKSKAIGETLMNRDSSRSHCIFTIYVETAENQYVSVSFVRLLDDY
jgi:kinesin family protein 3/17